MEATSLCAARFLLLFIICIPGGWCMSHHLFDKYLSCQSKQQQQFIRTDTQLPPWKISKEPFTVYFTPHPPHLIPQQHETSSSGMCTYCLTQFYCSVNMQSPSFLCFRAFLVSIRGVIVQRIGEGELSVFLAWTLLRTKHTEKNIMSLTSAKTIWVKTQQLSREFLPPHPSSRGKHW